ncbi:restriction endonuclease subunit S [Candidatus Chloroploca sp. Khr17]|uniref:restriction endonuclease subunit S n=1 Tax=Candidatus Chloroploca sp. Khr17 TaxID=2496869 RepID=UPI00101B69FB|nr:restriction endonuclease subunit S [Candidatus Chloroploca sp. Khr17]
MELKPGYKETDLGPLPSDWTTAKLEEIGLVVNGLTYAPSDVRSYGTLVLRSSNIQNDALAFEDNVFVDMEIPERIMVRPDDVLICVRNGSRILIGKTALLDERTIGMAFGAFMAVFRSDHGRYVNYLFRSHIMKRQIDEHLGATINQITNKSLKSFQIPVPSTDDEIDAIATALSDADALLDGLDRLIAKKRDLKQAAMQKLLTGKTRLPGFEGEWKPLNMAQDSTLKARIGWQGLTTAEYLESGQYALVTGTDFFDGKIDWDGCHFVEKVRYDQDKYIKLQINDVLLTKDGTIGKAAFVDKLPYPATLNSGVFVIRPKNGSYVPKYFFYILRSQIFVDFLNKLQAGSTISHLYQKDFVNFEFLAPVTVEEQSAIATVLSDMDAELAALEQRRNKTKDIKQAMMQELLTGKTRLVTPGGSHV